MEVALYFVIVAGLVCTVDTQTLQCTQAAATCALQLTNVLLQGVLQNPFSAADNTCSAVDAYRRCLNGDTLQGCLDIETTFQDKLTELNVDIQKCDTKGIFGFTSITVYIFSALAVFIMK